MKKMNVLYLFVFLFILAGCETTSEPVRADVNKPVFGDVGSLIVTIGDSMNLFEGVTATDEEDGDLTSEIVITNFTLLPIENNVFTTEGEYTVTYNVTDSDGYGTIYNRQLIVNPITGACGSTIEGMVLTFCDDFTDAVNPDATGLDMDLWGYQNGDGSEYGIPGWGNNEQQYYQEENSYVEEGLLYIEAELDTVGGKAYTSSKIVTNTKFSQAFGRFEARIMLPAGDGLWPAFWLMPEDSVYGGWARSGEIDILEAKGRLVDQVSGAIHYGGSWPNNTYQHGSYDFAEGESITDFHVYAVEWTDTSIKWFVDDDLVWEATDWYSEGNEFPAPFDQEFFMILNLAVGGNFDGNRLPDSSIFDEDVVMVIDYVRVFQYEQNTK